MAEPASDPLIWIQGAAPEVAPHLLFAVREGHWELEDVVALCARLRRLPLALEFPGALATALARVTPVLTGDESPGDLTIMPEQVLEDVLRDYLGDLKSRAVDLERRVQLGVANDDERLEHEAIKRLHEPDGSSGPEPDSDTLDLVPEDEDTTTAAPASEPTSADKASVDALVDPVDDLLPHLNAPPPEEGSGPDYTAATTTSPAPEGDCGASKDDFIVVHSKARRLVLSDGAVVGFGQATALWESMRKIIESRRKHPEGGWTDAPKKGHRDDIIGRIREAGVPPERVVERDGSKWRLAARPRFEDPPPTPEQAAGTA